MTISEFMAIFNEKATNDEKEAFVQEHIIDKYIPYETKADAALAIINTSYFTKVKNSDNTETREFNINSVSKYMLTCLSYLQLYTDIERGKDGTTVLQDFNTLNEAGIFDMIARNMNQRELEEYNRVIKMVSDDTIANEYDIHGFVKKQVERFGKLVGSTLAPIIENIDMDMLQEIVNKLEK